MSNLIINFAKRTGGKAGKGKNRTSTVRVFDTDTNCIVKAFTYLMSDYESKEDAVDQACKHIQKVNARRTR